MDAMRWKKTSASRYPSADQSRNGSLVTVRHTSAGLTFDSICTDYPPSYFAIESLHSQTTLEFESKPILRSNALDISLFSSRSEPSL